MQPPMPAAKPHKVHLQPVYKQMFIDRLLPEARKAKLKWRVPIAITLAQGALESSWGRTVVDNAYFGIKGKTDGEDTTKFATSEFINGKWVVEHDSFRAYKDLAEATDDYGRFLNANPRYKPAFLHVDNPFLFIHELVKAKYGSGPDYEKTISDMIRYNNLDQYDKP